MPLYRLNAEERRLIDLALTENVDYFTDYYLRGPNSGTWWLPAAKNKKWKEGYDRLQHHWEQIGKPAKFDFAGHTYQVQWQHEKSKQTPDLPAFHNNHGVLMLPYQKQIHHDRHTIITCIGGKGSSKTWGIALSDLINAATLPDYRSFVLAPYTVQVEEVYRQMLRITDGTLYRDRFFIKAVMRPNPMIVIGNDLVGENTIEFYSILTNPEKLLTLTGDRAVIDQAEKLDNLKDVIHTVLTRFRGRARGGRPRIGTITLIANSADNQQLWDLHDMAEVDPDNYSSYTVSSYDNPYLTDKDIERFETSVGNDEEAIRVHLKGGRPMGNGKEFSREVLQRIADHDLDRIMLEHSGEDGYIKLEAQGVGVYEWLLPPLSDHTYLVISDPGTDNPPNRNSPPIFIWDISKFPKEPALLVGFVWVYGNGDIANWATRYAELVNRYKAIGRNGFDATGFQSGYDQWMAILNNLYAEKINLSGNGKPLCLNAAKIIASQGLVKVPASITHIFSQLSRYDIEEDRTGKKLRQDLVMAFIMSAWWMQRLYYTDDSPFTPRPDYDPKDRAFRVLEDRYGSHIR